MGDAEHAGTPWSAEEIDLIVADYFEMLRMDILGKPYSKAGRNKALRELIDRSRGSIEYKHQNISAVLLEHDEPWIPGYKPAANYQGDLREGIFRYLDARGEAAIPRVEDDRWLAPPGDSGLAFGPPPALSPPRAADEEDRAAFRRLARKFDPVARDARNRKLGRMGEERVLRSEHARLAGAGRGDLARRVKWVSQEEGDGAGYDILSFAETGDERLLEVKTTRGGARMPFYLTENERRLSLERPEEFRLVRLYDFRPECEPRAFELAPPLEQAVILSPTAYRASFGP